MRGHEVDRLIREIRDQVFVEHAQGTMAGRPWNAAHAGEAEQDLTGLRIGRSSGAEMLDPFLASLFAGGG